MESKQVFIGALYEFSEEARATIIEEYREGLPAGAAKPFISYDERTHLFSFTCDRTDSAAVSNFYSSVYAYVDFFEKRPKDLVHSPLLIPMQGTVIEDTLVLDDIKTSGADLLSGGEDSDSEVDGNATTYNTPFWAPQTSSSKILTNDIARAITESTEANLFPEHDRNRVVIMGGDATAALEMLTNLEPLMDFLAQQSREGANRPSANVLMLLSLDDLSTLDFKFVSACPLATERVVVDLQSRPHITNKSMTQVLHREDRHGPWLPAGNMTEEVVRESATATEGFSQIWKSCPYTTFGDPRSKNPASTNNVPSAPILAPQKFVTASQAHDISKWNENTAEGIDPDEIAPEAPFEAVPLVGRQRKVREDSDDEEDECEEEEFETPAPPATKRIPVLDSDDEEEEVEPQVPPATKRVAIVDSDDENETPATPATNRVPVMDSDDENEEVGAPAAPATKYMPLLVSDNGEEEFDTSAQPVTKQVLASDSDDQADEIVCSGPAAAQDKSGEVGHGEHIEEPLIPMLAAEQPRKDLQPTWISNPFSIIAEQGEQRGASSLPRSVVQEPLPSSPHRSPPQSPHLSPHPSPGLSPQPSSSRSHQIQSPDLLDAQLSITERHEENGSPKTPMSPARFPSRDEFDPNAYGRARRGGYESPTMQPPYRPIASPAQGRGRGRGRPNPSRPAPSLRGRSACGYQSSYNHADLVHLSTVISTKNIQPPPGLEIRANRQESNSHSSSFDLLDGPLDDLQVPSIRPSPVAFDHTQESHSASIRRSSNISSADSGASYVNRHNPPLNLARIENEQLARLFAMRKDAKEAKERTRLAREAAERLNAESQEPSQLTGSCNDTQRRQADDERSSRRVHDTMRQQGPKPGKKGKQIAPKLTEKERKQRLDEVLGEIESKMPPPVTTSTSADQMSARKKQALKKNPEIDPETTSRLIAEHLSSRQTTNLVQCLEPLFSAGRGFPGHLKFEIHLGQALIANSKLATDGDVQLFTIKNWEKMFRPSVQQPVATAFTNILTRNGHDVDRMLKMKPPQNLDGRGPEKLFDELQPGCSYVSYEFHCQSKECEEFWIVVDGTGEHSIRKSTSVIGTVNLHYPASIWDARAVLHGTATFCEPDEETIEIVESFMQSVYVPAQEAASITYRQPAENDMTVRSVRVKRTSLHNCHAAEDLQLQIVEVKELFNRFHTRDKKLTQAFEKAYQEMFENDRIHYEVSLVHVGINKMLKQNIDLKTGDLTEGTTSKQVLKPLTVQRMLDLASHIVSKIDWAGLNNNGTLLRTMQQEQEQFARIASTLPGTRRAPSFAGLTSTAAGGPTALRSNVHGIRINTRAEVGYDADGNQIFIGMGGAQIPIPATGDELNVRASELAPNDSASNIGVENPQPYVPNAAYARGQAARGPNFW